MNGKRGVHWLVILVIAFVALSLVAWLVEDIAAQEQATLESCGWLALNPDGMTRYMYGEVVSDEAMELIKAVVGIEIYNSNNGNPYFDIVGAVRFELSLVPDGGGFGGLCRNGDCRWVLFYTDRSDSEIAYVFVGPPNGCVDESCANHCCAALRITRAQYEAIREAIGLPKPWSGE